MDLAPVCHTPPALIVVAGQSNALGYTLGPADLPHNFGRSVPDVWIWEASKARFTPMTPAQNTGSPNNPKAWGAEVQFAFRWRAAFCSPLYIVKHARGDTGLAADPQELDWSPSSSGELFDATAAEIAAAKAALAAKGFTPRVKALLWMQGEKDASEESKGTAYEANLRDFISQVRTRWGDARTVIHIGQIDRMGPSYPGAAKVRLAQARVAASEKNVSLVDTDPLPRQAADGLHLTGQAQIRLGDEFFEAQAPSEP